MNTSNNTADAHSAQHPNDLRRHVRDIFRDPALRRRAHELVELTRKSDPRADCLQLICLSGRRIVNAFWCADFELDLRGIAHEGDAARLVLIGLGPYFPLVAAEDAFARCIAPAQNIVPVSGRSLLDLDPLNAVADWLRRERPSAARK